MRIFAIDPDVKLSGWASFFDLELMFCGVTPSNSVPVGLYPPDLVVVEVPQIYVRRKSKGDPNDLVRITAAGGELAGRTAALSGSNCPVEFVLPRTWKGQLSKELSHSRMRAFFEQRGDERSLAALDAIPSRFSQEQQLEVLDACALGLWRARKAQLSIPSLPSIG